jgi:hypothetical protein
MSLSKRYKILEVKFSTCVITHHGMEMYGLVVVQLHAFVNAALDEGVWPASQFDLVG